MNNNIPKRSKKELSDDYDPPTIEQQVGDLIHLNNTLKMQMETLQDQLK